MSEKILVTIPYTYKQYRKPENRSLRNCVDNVSKGSANNVAEYYAEVLGNQYLNRVKADYYCFIADVWEKTWGSCLPKAKKLRNELSFEKSKSTINNKVYPCVSIEWVFSFEPFCRGYDIDKKQNTLWIGSTTYWDDIRKQLSLGITFGEYEANEGKLVAESEYEFTFNQRWEHTDNWYRYLCPAPENDTAANLMELEQIDLEPLRAAAEEVLQNYR